jgi:hypothetical protein
VLKSFTRIVLIKSGSLNTRAGLKPIKNTPNLVGYIQGNYDTWQLEAFAFQTDSRSGRQRRDAEFAAIPACRESGSTLFFSSVYDNTKFLFTMFKGAGGLTAQRNAALLTNTSNFFTS